MLIFFHQYAAQLTNAFSRSTIGTYVKVALSVFIVDFRRVFAYGEKVQFTGLWKLRFQVHEHQPLSTRAMMYNYVHNNFKSLANIQGTQVHHIMHEIKRNHLKKRSSLVVPRKNIFLSMILFVILLNSGKAISKKLQQPDSALATGCYALVISNKNSI